MRLIKNRCLQLFLRYGLWYILSNDGWKAAVFLFPHGADIRLFCFSGYRRQPLWKRFTIRFFWQKNYCQKNLNHYSGKTDPCIWFFRWYNRNYQESTWTIFSYCSCAFLLLDNIFWIFSQICNKSRLRSEC